MRLWVKYVLMGAALVCINACTTPKIAEQAAPEFASENLHAVKNTGFEYAYVLPGADLPAFGTVVFAEMQSADIEIPQTTLSGTNRRDWLMTPEKEQKLASVWRDATGSAFSDYPKDAEGALEVTAALKRAEPRRSSSSAGTGAGAGFHSSGDVVEISVEFRITNAANRELLAVVRDRRSIASLQWGRSAGVDLVNLFNSWASLLHTRVAGR